MFSAGGTQPFRRASHALEYVPELDALVMYGGTCGDDSEVYIYDIESNTWCDVVPPQRPSLRDAFLWGMDFPYFYVYGGDVICLNPGKQSVSDGSGRSWDGRLRGWWICMPRTDGGREGGKEEETNNERTNERTNEAAEEHRPRTDARNERTSERTNEPQHQVSAARRKQQSKQATM